jgi:hypothetical protein
MIRLSRSRAFLLGAMRRHRRQTRTPPRWGPIVDAGKEVGGWSQSHNPSEPHSDLSEMPIGGVKVTRKFALAENFGLGEGRFRRARLPQACSKCRLKIGKYPFARQTKPTGCKKEGRRPRGSRNLLWTRFGLSSRVRRRRDCRRCRSPSHRRHLTIRATYCIAAFQNYKSEEYHGKKT